MAESADKAAKSADEAAAAAAADAKPVTKPAEAAPAAGPKPAAAESAPASKPVAATPPPVAPAPKRTPAAPKAESKKTPVAKKPVNKKAGTATNVTRTKPSPSRGPAQKAPTAAPAVPEPTISELKEKIMANANFTMPMGDALSEVQARAKAAFEKSTEIAAEMTEFSKGNVEAFVESGKTLAGGMQDLGRTYVEDARTAYETLTADMKEMASVKSPTELLQLQARVARRNFDSMFAYSSKNGEAMMKLVSEAFAPISGRMSLAAEKISRAA
ncbi:TIGR01841 family phasin [Altererythrobacter soli]|uniref:TIGR01841 family phasin n=1 Tax=Croceibacterium soli TaxID=1739690 RepID=A0A6I4USC8_9SPHN|nr:phasin family protein [Croceibacterium soli]MXP40664.1 TIGR01841 family phasin [Croceibacterium soli]